MKDDKTNNIKTKKKRNTKSKVYIAPYKIIIICAFVITICMALLLITTFASENKKKENNKESVAIEKQIEKEELPIREPLPGTKREEKTNDTLVTTTEKSTEPESFTTIEIESIPSKKIDDKTEETPKETKSLTENKRETNTSLKKDSQKHDTFGFPEAVNNAQLIFVFDDAGHNINQTKAFLDLPFPFTVAVLPHLAFSKESADVIRNSGNEVILHQPMQAINLNEDPGPGAITPDMNENEIISTLFQNITEIGPIAGMNNHEGSAITADAEKMAIILRFASQEGIFFLDSRTNVDTAVPYVAKELGYSYFERNIFLDNEKTRENILTELKKGLNIANRNGCVIMIGHIWSADILPDILIEVYPELKEKGYTFSVVSKSKAGK